MRGTAPAGRTDAIYIKIYYFNIFPYIKIIYGNKARSCRHRPVPAACPALLRRAGGGGARAPHARRLGEGEWGGGHDLGPLRLCAVAIVYKITKIILIYYKINIIIVK